MKSVRKETAIFPPWNEFALHNKRPNQHNVYQSLVVSKITNRKWISNKTWNTLIWIPPVTDSVSMQRFCAFFRFHTFTDRNRQTVANNLMQWLFTRRCFRFTWSLVSRPLIKHHPQLSNSSMAVRWWRRLRSQNALTRTPVKLSDKLVRKRKARYSGPLTVLIFSARFRR